MKGFEMKFLKDGIQITVRWFDNGYLATVDKLDEDGDVEYGSSGYFKSTISEAVISAIENVLWDWGADDANAALKAAYERGALKRFELISWFGREAFVYEGIAYFIDSVAAFKAYDTFEDALLD